MLCFVALGFGYLVVGLLFGFDLGFSDLPWFGWVGLGWMFCVWVIWLGFGVGFFGSLCVIVCCYLCLG